MLEKYDKEIVQRRDVVTTRLSAEIVYLDALIHETEESCKKPASEFLQVRLSWGLLHTGLYVARSL